MIIAGAGSGKTRVLTYRIANLIDNGVNPDHILALTFTNKAAREMTERIGKLIGEKGAKKLWMGTFHSVFARILRKEAELLGFSRYFTIYDTEDSKGMLKEIIKTKNLDDKVYKTGLVYNRISGAKNRLLSANHYTLNHECIEMDRMARTPYIGEIYKAYQKGLFRAGAMDFDDLLFNTNVLLRDSAVTLLKYQELFQYILVDEYQDTNFSQYAIVKQLAARNENICIVGDDAQSIYSFRGASIQNILGFQKHYPDVKKIMLDQNYRSTQLIVKAANQVIANNKDQHPKEVWTENGLGEKIKCMRSDTDSEEAFWVAYQIGKLKDNEGIKNSEIAILYRTNAQSRNLEEAFIRKQIPFRIFGGTSFYQRKEIKNALAYFRIAGNPHDDESLKRVINYPARGIGHTTLDKIVPVAFDHDISIFTVLENPVEFDIVLNAGTQQKISQFVEMIKHFGVQNFNENAYTAAMFMLQRSGLLKELAKDKDEPDRLENVNELISAIKNFTELEEEEVEIEEVEVENEEKPAEDEVKLQNGKAEKKLAEFISEVALITDLDREDQGESDKVSMMTIHAAKGLEFPVVFLVGLEEELFPSSMSMGSKEDLEEERRLFYVALTRAEKRVFISWAGKRFKFGNYLFTESSRFLNEIDDVCIDHLGISEGNSGNEKNKVIYRKQAEYLRPVGRVAGNLKKIETGNAGITPEREQVIRNLAKDAKVYHEKFGKGLVLDVEGSAPNVKATIQFEAFGKKQLLLKYTNLKII